MRYFHLISIILILITASVQAQMDVSVPRKEFRTESPGFEEAWSHIKKGDSYFKDGGVFYLNAFLEYQQANAYNSASAVLNYKLGASCLFSDRRDEAYTFLNKAFDLNPDVARDILLLTGRALMYIGKYSTAKEKFYAYLSGTDKKTKESIILVNRYLEECSAALILVKDTLRLEIANMGGNINSTSDDYSEILSNSGQLMLFASRRAQSAKAKNFYKDSKLDENIYSADYLNGAWSVARIFDKTLYTKYCETPLYMNNPGTQLYLYTGYEGGGDIMVSKMKKGKWNAPEKVSFNVNSKFPETSFTISGNGDEIAFVSNRKRNGIGEKDIYLMTKINSRRWSKPVNAGISVNTPYDEESVKFSAGGDTLWFSSRGHNSIGGFDIFYSTRSPLGIWNQAVNAGYPLNTSYDEMFYIPSPAEDSSFFFVSNRGGGFGGLDIYKGRYLPPPPPPAPVVIPKPLPPPVPVTIPVKTEVQVPVPVPVPVPVQKPDTIFIRDTVVVVKEVKQEVQPVIQPVVIPEPPKELILYIIGKITDSESGVPVFARIEVVDLSTDQVIITTASSDVDGTYRIRLPAKKSYMVNIRSSGFLAEMKLVSIPATYTEEIYLLDVALNKVKVGKKVVLNNILFELGKAVLASGSFSELDKLVNLLEENPKMKIELSGHTDNTGNPVVNAKLSTDRAKAVVDYLVQKGIDQGRLSYQGFGSDQPIADNATPDGRTKNRRVEFKIVGF
jgi:outer membrane protein OmpA-like peptidoglycan-associated protein/tetratricopeptide (TPR) repeat protein